MWIDRIRQVKVALIIAAVVIATASLIVSHALISDLQNEEISKMEVWAEAMRSLNNADENTDLNLVLKVINGNNTIPIIVLDSKGNVADYRNIKLNASTAADSASLLLERSREMRSKGHVMQIDLTAGHQNKAGKKDYILICYEESLMLRRLAGYPYVQLGVVALFVVVAAFALLSSKRAEQNKVWVGLSKETAHQLGTPISSLMAWTEVLRETYPDDELLKEMDSDVRRLELIAERFSKIGSAPELKEADLCEIVAHVVEYIGRRTSDKVLMRCSFPSDSVMVRANAPLFEWVIEVLCKNAIDAMSGEGEINIYTYRKANHLVMLVSDTGKGISHKHFNDVFKPGYTTKKRGWGLGLSLTKRIVEEYHHGHIYVKSSELGKGTTFAIELNV